MDSLNFIGPTRRNFSLLFLCVSLAKKMQFTSSGFFALKVPVSAEPEAGRESDTVMFAEQSGILSNDFFLFLGRICCQIMDYSFHSPHLSLSGEDNKLKDS